MLQEKIHNELAERTVLGGAVLAAQRMEFLLYGLVAHFEDELKRSDKRFRDLTPESFLRGDLADLRSTRGQLADTYGDELLLSTDDLNRFVKNRNLIVHNYWRLTKSGIRDGPLLDDPMQFLLRFIKDCQKWGRILMGVPVAMKQAIESSDTGQRTLIVDEMAYLDDYIQHVESRLPPGDPDPSRAEPDSIGTLTRRTNSN